MSETIDLRFDAATARHIADALQLQAEYGYDRAWKHLEDLGVPAGLAREILCIRFDRRKASPPSPSTVGFFAQAGDKLKAE